MEIFNNIDQKTNGELYFIDKIKDDVNIIFDVGSRDYSLFLELKKEVHYFEPLPKFFDTIKTKKNNNLFTKFNNFGLSDLKEKIPYYEKFESFSDRSQSLKTNSGFLELNVDTGKNYMLDNNVKNIDFLKIDTEGFELKVLKGFDDYLKYVKIIQFEYGGTYIDSKIKLIDVINHLKHHNFGNFNYISNDGLTPVDDYKDHYNYCNIICYNNLTV